MPNMVQIIKQAAVEAVEAGKPLDVVYGTVVTAAPLSIRINQQLTVDGRFLALTRNVTDFDVEVTITHKTEPAGAHSHSHSVTTSTGSGSTDTNREPDHVHSYSGRKTFRIHNGLKPGEKVIMLRASGGQKYIVLDRVV